MMVLAMIIYSPQRRSIINRIVIGWNTVSRGVAYRVYYGTSANPSTAGNMIALDQMFSDSRH
jgi:hypothetical protein